jgi:hypothetical protein
MKKLILNLILFALVFSLGAGAAIWFTRHHGSDHHGYNHSESYDHDDQHDDDHYKMGDGKGHGMGQGMGHGGGHSGGHDEVNMPGLNGKDTTPDEVNDLKTLFQNHEGITRDVVLLPNGIKTITEAADETLRDAIVNHVSMMITRLEDGQNPEVMIQLPTLDKLFAVYQDIETTIEMIEMGVAVVQTSTNLEAVRLLQTHAAEVSDMAARGMEAVHERMMRSGDGGHHQKKHSS